MRSERELRILAEIIDAVVAGIPRRGGDIGTQRFIAVELAASEGGKWERHLEASR